MGEVISYTKEGIDENLGNAIFGIGTDGNVLLLTKGDGSVIEVPIGLGSVVNLGIDGAVITGTKGDGTTVDATLVTAMGVVVHGADPNVARPTGYSVVHWIGTVDPVNAVENDLWTNA